METENKNKKDKNNKKIIPKNPEHHKNPNNQLNQKIKELEEKNKTLEESIKFLEEEKSNFEAELNKKFLETIEKKSKEVSEILRKKEEEIKEKYQAEFSQLKDYLYEKQFSNLVEIVSQFETVLDLPTSSPEIKNYLLGFKMFSTQFNDLLSSLNISKIEPKNGDAFDSEIMVAISTEQVKDKNLESKVLAVISKGYKLHRRVIKLASVKVGVFEN